MARAARRERERRRGGPWLATLSLLLACATGADDGPTSGVVLGDASAEGGTDSGPDATSLGGTDDGASGQVDGTGDGADTTAGGGATDDGPADESSGGPPPICTVEPDDVPCEVCGKEQCCAQYLVCIEDVMCACALECYLAGGETADCFLMCGASPLALELFNCAAPACDGICT